MRAIHVAGTGCTKHRDPLRILQLFHVLIRPCQPVPDEGNVALGEMLELRRVPCWDHGKNVVQTSRANRAQERVLVAQVVEVSCVAVVHAERLPDGAVEMPVVISTLRLVEDEAWDARAWQQLQRGVPVVNRTSLVGADMIRMQRRRETTVGLWVLIARNGSA